ncbi:MAG: M23 family metallopeptidase [Oscillospiraceae bacterium]|nr:M23 family metallopeptidase [Oscillospiraceae bacterium]
MPESRNFKKHSFYLAVGVCILAVSAAAWSTFVSVRELSGPDTVSSERKNRGRKEKQETVVQKETVKGNANAFAGSELENSKQSVSLSDEKENIRAVSSSNIDFALVIPCDKVVRGYSGEELDYSPEFGDWRIHSEVDFAGRRVLALTNGKVLSVDDEPGLGKKVTLNHEISGKSYTGCYRGLNTCNVCQGDSLKSGDILGEIDEVNGCLHFSLKDDKESKFVDPDEILGLDKVKSSVVKQVS